MEESPGGRSPVFSEEKAGVKRRVSSGKLAPPPSPQLSFGAEGAPQSPPGWVGLFSGARTPPSYRRAPQEGGDPGQGGPPPPRQTPQDPCERAGGGEAGRDRPRSWAGPLKKISIFLLKNKTGKERGEEGNKKYKMIVFKRSVVFRGGKRSEPRDPPVGVAAPSLFR